MKIFLLIVLFALLAASAHASVLELEGANFDSAIAGRAAFVKFYAPWCGHCKRLAPAYEEVGERLARYSDRVAVVKVDCDAHAELCQRFDVGGYPTLKFFAAGASLDSASAQAYSGAREADALVEYISGRIGVRVAKKASAVAVLDESNFDAQVLDAGRIAFVEFFAPWCGHCKSLAPTWEKLAQVFANDANVLVANVDCDAHSALGSRYDVSGFPTIKVFGADNEPQEYNGGRDLDSLVAWVNKLAKTQRTNTGLLSSDAGRIEALDAVAAHFVQSLANGDADAQQEALDAIASSEHSDTFEAKVYRSAVNKIAGQQGIGYVRSETERLERLIESDSIKSEKRDQFQKRINILASFD